MPSINRSGYRVSSIDLHVPVEVALSAKLLYHYGEIGSLERQLVPPERDDADNGYLQRLASRFDARQEIVNFLTEGEAPFWVIARFRTRR